MSNLMATPTFYLCITATYRSMLDRGHVLGGSVCTAINEVQPFPDPLHETRTTQESQNGKSRSPRGSGTGEFRNNLISPTQRTLLAVWKRAPRRQVAHVGKFLLIRNPCISNRAVTIDHGRKMAWFS
jgi:hypothetical protein